ncbi:Rne/Rng family ribonuclease [Alloprevotella rava]|uniref:Ribonuclease G n=1 Tax=Alloprevotella rava TaxID=671218 RepID=A0A7W5UKR5_9BACT|nr:Rne/Rng family ribonuclease [Alloprevotella rava]MBB3703146.1 ribonuclease G [Alloprevotella rava]
MTSEVIVDVRPKEISIALLEDKRLVEYQQEGREAHFSVGNIYLAKVKKIMPGLNACFVNVGYERDAFLHYLDLGIRYRSLDKYMSLLGDGRKDASITKALGQGDLEKEGSVQNVVKQGQEVLVQIQKEPMSTKGPRVSCDISFPGRFLVLIPFSDKISVSSKIRSSQERARLKQLIHSIKPKGFGVIIRTVAEGKRASELDLEIKILYQRWEETISKVRKARQAQKKIEAEAKSPQQALQNYRPTLCYEETSRAVALLRDLFNPSYENIYINDKEVFNDIRAYVSMIAPTRLDIVKLYQGNVPIFDNFSVTRQIKSSFGRTVTYKHGAYLIIEHTEALHVIDVNSGNRSRSPEGQEVNALDVNLGAADELARQLRLRDMGGIIVVDFIDMAQPENRQKLYERMVENMKSDRARHNILPLSKFGLMQITRQRVRPVEEPNVEETCPTCGGTGKIKPSILFTDLLEGKIRQLSQQLHFKRIRLHVHPYIAAYLDKGFISLKRKWQFKYKTSIQLTPNEGLAYLQYQFYNDKGEEIDMRGVKEMA